MGMRNSFRWFLAQKFWEWYVLFKEIFWNWNLTLLEIMGMSRFGLLKSSLLFCSANTGQNPLPYSGIGSRNSAKILSLGHYRNS